MRGRWLGLGAVAALVAGGLTGCVRPPAGYTGISVDTAGDPVAILAWCGRAPKQIVVTAEPMESDQLPSLKALVIRAPALSGHTAGVNLRNPAGDWVITNNSLSIDDDHSEYYVYGQTDSPDDTSSAQFTLADLDQISPTQVLGDDDRGISRAIDVHDFERAVTSQC